MEYNLAIKEKKILPFVTVWMDSESIMLSDLSQSEKDKYHVISLIGGTNWTNKENGDILGEQDDSWGAQLGGEGIEQKR